MTLQQERLHPFCIVCGKSNERGLGLSFQVCEDGGVVGRFFCSRNLQGYTGLLHGGVISSILDGAMTNCLFASGKTAVTGKLNVRFVFPVLVDHEIVVRARVKKSSPPLHVMESELVQDGRIVSRASAKFMEIGNVNTKQVAF
ncbi:MAG: hypothetical protein A2X48_02550 [Lentisphaerae bacterium GWF2_49_21]|nr:MAG: hypothetical protein A2X48_02550 [Lentisphaerae bacterium GWF2_49_21]